LWWWHMIYNFLNYSLMSLSSTTGSTGSGLEVAVAAAAFFFATCF